jgi:hypothetical protein
MPRAAGKAALGLGLDPLKTAPRICRTTVFTQSEQCGLIVMSSGTHCPSLALLRSLRQLASSRPCVRRHPNVGRRSFHRSPKSLDEGDRSFQGQLYESTARRIKSQREAEARFAGMTPPTAFARNAAFTFCINPLIAATTTADLWQRLYSHAP